METVFVLYGMLLELTLLPWCVIGAGFLSILYCTTEEKYGFGTFSFIAAYTLLDWLLNWKMSIYAFHNPQHVLIGIGAYCIIGLLWSICKFTSYMLHKLKEYKIDKQKFIENNTRHFAKDVIDQKWNEEKKPHYIPSYSDATANVIWWMIYWPFSVIVSFMKDAIYNFFQWIFHTFSGVYKRIYNSFVAKFD